jgi:hypothetical protein
MLILACCADYEFGFHSFQNILHFFTKINLNKKCEYCLLKCRDLQLEKFFIALAFLAIFGFLASRNQFGTSLNKLFPKLTICITKKYGLQTSVQNSGNF